MRNSIRSLFPWLICAFAILIYNIYGPNHISVSAGCLILILVLGAFFSCAPGYKCLRRGPPKNVRHPRGQYFGNIIGAAIMLFLSGWILWLILTETLGSDGLRYCRARVVAQDSNYRGFWVLQRINFECESGINMQGLYVARWNIPRVNTYYDFAVGKKSSIVYQARPVKEKMAR